jgi:hypothetical protein
LRPFVLTPNDLPTRSEKAVDRNGWRFSEHISVAKGAFGAAKRVHPSTR